MKFKVNDCSGRELELVKWVEYSLDGDSYERGQVESAKAQAENVTTAFARLIEHLANKNILSREEIHLIVKGWEE